MNRIFRLQTGTIGLLTFALAATLWTTGLCLPIDRAVVAWAVEPARAEPWASVWKAITAIGDWPGWFLVTLGLIVIAAGLSIRHRLPIQPREALAWGALAIFGQLGNSLLKLTFRRERPPLESRLVHESTYSFPSGHSFFAAAAFGLLAYLAWNAARPRSRVWAIVLVTICGLTAILIGSSRVALGVHYPTDVIGGLALGAAWVDSAWRITRASERRSDSEAPPSARG